MKKPSLPNLRRLESQLRKRGYKLIAGVDEAGRGPLAGPVVAAACILPDDLRLSGINDSKKLTAEKREELYARIKENPDILSGVGVVEALIIDQINILQATLQAMAFAVAQLQQKPNYVLVDGNQLPRLDIPCEGIVEGDTFLQPIMAAAIIAKVTRDRMMLEYHKIWPQYGFAEHKGYPTPKHCEILKKLGPCPIHRRSYEPVKMALK